MPLRELDGPAGRLEALLEEPAADRAVGDPGEEIAATTPGRDHRSQPQDSLD